MVKHHQSDIEKGYLYIKDPFEPKYQLLINGRKKLWIKELKNTKALIYYSKATDVYVNLEDYNATKEKGVIDNTINWC